MSGTNFPTGVATKKGYDGSSSYLSHAAATTKFIQRMATIRCDAQTTETATGFTLPTTAIVTDVYLNVITIDATETVDVGTATGSTSNDPNGYLTTASLATAGLVKGSLADGAITYGVLLYEETGTGVDVAYARTNDITAGGDNIVYTCSAGSDTAVFDIIILYMEVVS